MAGDVERRAVRNIHACADTVELQRTACFSGVDAGPFTSVPSFPLPEESFAVVPWPSSNFQ